MRSRMRWSRRMRGAGGLREQEDAGSRRMREQEDEGSRRMR